LEISLNAYPVNVPVADTALAGETWTGCGCGAGCTTITGCCTIWGGTTGGGATPFTLRFSQTPVCAF